MLRPKNLSTSEKGGTEIFHSGLVDWDSGINRTDTKGCHTIKTTAPSLERQHALGVCPGMVD